MEWSEVDDKFHTANQQERWEMVQFCCSNLAKKILRGVSIDDDKFHDRLMDAVVECMARIEQRGEPEKLSSYCYWPVWRSFKGTKAQRADKERSNWRDTYEDTAR